MWCGFSCCHRQLAHVQAFLALAEANHSCKRKKDADPAATPARALGSQLRRRSCGREDSREGASCSAASGRKGGQEAEAAGAERLCACHWHLPTVRRSVARTPHADLTRSAAWISSPEAGEGPMSRRCVAPARPPAPACTGLRTTRQGAEVWRWCSPTPPARRGCCASSSTPPRSTSLPCAGRRRPSSTSPSRRRSTSPSSPASSRCDRPTSSSQASGSGAQWQFGMACHQACPLVRWCPCRVTAWCGCALHDRGAARGRAAGISSEDDPASAQARAPCV